MECLTLLQERSETGKEKKESHTQFHITISTLQQIFQNILFEMLCLVSENNWFTYPKIP